MRTGAAYPQEELDALWKQVLLHEFHDILPGTSIAWVHREAVEQYARVEREAEELVARSLAALAGAGEERVAVDGAGCAGLGTPAGAGVLAAALADESVQRTAPVALARQGDDVVLDNGVLRVRAVGRGAGHVGRRPRHRA